MSTTAPNVPQITVDSQNETVELQFIDDRGNQTSAPQGASVTFSASDGSVTFEVDPTNPFKAKVVPSGTPGSPQISVTVSGTNLPNPDPVTIQVNPGAAVGERLVVSETAQAPVPTPAPTPDPNPAPAPTTPTDPTTTPTNPTQPAPTTGTATDSSQLEKSAYTYNGNPANVDTTVWAPTGYQTDEATPRPLYYFSGDTAPGQASGNGADDGSWEFYTGPVTQVGA